MDPSKFYFAASCYDTSTNGEQIAGNFSICLQYSTRFSSIENSKQNNSCTGKIRTRTDYCNKNFGTLPIEPDISSLVLKNRNKVILSMTMAFRHILSLYLVLALAWSEEALSFSSTSYGTRTSPSTKHSSVTTKIQSQLPLLNNQKGILRTTSTYPRFQNTRMAMTTDDSSGEKEATKEQEEGKEASDSQKSNVILIFPLFCKFMVVLLIKFLTDLIVVPTLLVWRLARKTKRKIITWFGKLSFSSSPSSFKPNGSSK